LIEGDFEMKKTAFLGLIITATALMTTACSTVAEKTNMLSDADLVTKASGVLGVDYSEVSLLSKHMDGTNTYFQVKQKGGRIFNCQVNGGNLLSFGMTNPTSCMPK